MTTATLPLTASTRWITALAAVGAAGLLLWAAASAHLHLACTVMDTPYLPLCAEPPATPDELQDQLRQRIRRNPGDSWAWVRLLVARGAQKPEAVLPAAVTVFPNNSNVLRWRAATAIRAGRMEEGVALLVQLLQYRGSSEAAQLIAQLAVSPEGRTLLRPHLREARRWLPGALAAMPALKIPAGQALPIVVEALEHGALTDQAVRDYMRSLKAGGAWLDAYGLWLSQHKQVVPLLYNGGFDQPFVQDGFDWEFTPVVRSRAGVIIQQQAMARRGLVLELEFTGRSFTSPLLRQYIFAPAGAYRLRGEYMASKLRSEGGLAWNVFCTSARKALPTRAAPIQDTGGLWKVVELEFTIPPDCGPVASLQLEPVVALESGSGLKGRVAFDGFGLTRTAN